MTENIDLKGLERKAYRSTFQDGLWDIFWGLLILGFGLSPWLFDLGLHRPWNTILVMLPAPLMLTLGKRFITIPRLRLAEVGPKRKSSKTRLKFLIGISALIPLMLILLLLADIIEISPGHYAVALSAGLFLIMILSAIAYFLDFGRLYLYAWMFALSLVGAEYLSDHLGLVAARLIACGLISAIILIIGLVLLLRFLVEPLTDEGVKA